MTHCHNCGSELFKSEVPGVVHVVVDGNGTIRITELYHRPFFYVNCVECNAVYSYENGKIGVPRETLIRKICMNCDQNGIGCTECDMMTHRTNYQISRIENVNMFPLYE